MDLENTLEQEQELLVNRLWKRMDRLEAEKRWEFFWLCSLEVIILALGFVLFVRAMTMAKS